MLVLFLGCSSKTEGAAPPVSEVKTVTASAPATTDWRPLIPAGANIEERLNADLDGDGTNELIVLSSKVDPDVAETQGANKEQTRMELELTLQIFSKCAVGFAEIGRSEMLGGPQPLKVTNLQGGGKRKMVVASALHCGGSCAGIELHVLTVRDQRVQHLLDRESVNKGYFMITPDGALEVRELISSTAEDRLAAGYRIIRYVMKGDTLVAVSKRKIPPNH